MRDNWGMEERAALQLASGWRDTHREAADVQRASGLTHGLAVALMMLPDPAAWGVETNGSSLNVLVLFDDPNLWRVTMSGAEIVSEHVAVTPATARFTMTQR